MASSAIVIGAGVIGIGTAYALARRGWQVTLIDEAEKAAMRSSHANGAQLSYCYTDALGSPATFAALPTFVRAREGVSIRPFGGPDYLAWLVQFARNCTAARFRENTLALLRLGLESRDAMDRLCAEHALEFGRRVTGKLLLLHSPEEFDRARRSRDLKQGAVDFEQVMLDRAELPDLDPALGGVAEDVVGAIHTPSEEVGDPFLFCNAMVDLLREDYGVEVRFGSSVSRVEQTSPKARIALDNGERLEADAAVVCAGTGSNRLLAPLGHRIPIQPMKGYSFEMPLANGSPHVSVTDVKRRIVIVNLGDRMRVAGFAALGRGSYAIEPGRIERLCDVAHDCMPNAGDYSKLSRPWAGLRPTTPTSQPVIARPAQGLAINAGHGALGWTLAMGSGERLAALLERD
ncbi:MAG: FAD-dependent oxidoreductase [Erythrobacter sp.]|nr:FAD-dependent oxidoreductase [Erythrobacter sp.]